MSVIARLVLFIALLLPAVAAAQERAPLTRIAFGSCADQDQPQPIWDAVLAYRPELFIFAGDNVYGDSTGPDLTQLKAAYAKAGLIEGYAKLRRSTRHLAIWDDHDMGVNDGGGDVPFKDASKQLFLEFWNIPSDDPRWQRGGLYHAATYGPAGQRVQVILLDTRFFRSPLKPTDQRGAAGRERYVPDPDPAKTMLGDEQWQWLAERLREPAELRLIVSSVQVLAEGHGWERWGNFPRERARLLGLIAETRAAGVVFLSGDRHIGALYRETAGAPYPLTEITSSGLNKTFPGNREASPNRPGAVYGAANFGTVDVDWWAGTVTLSLRDEAGQVKREESLRLADLTPR